MPIAPLSRPITILFCFICNVCLLFLPKWIVIQFRGERDRLILDLHNSPPFAPASNAMIRCQLNCLSISIAILKITSLLLIIRLPNHCVHGESKIVENDNKKLIIVAACNSISRPTDLSKPMFLESKIAGRISESASIWTKDQNDSTVFRISLTDLEAEGFNKWEFLLFWKLVSFHWICNFIRHLNSFLVELMGENEIWRN